MKNQYFGDINDYRKYGLLRCLAEAGQLSLGVCWMLTPSDGSSDGSLTRYLNSPADWRHLDPPLFDALRQSVIQGSERDVAATERLGLLPGAVYFDTEVPLGRSSRAGFMSACLEAMAGCDVVFFDPDNGIEVRSTPYGAKAAPKYVYGRELGAAFEEGHSLLVYQHYPRQDREGFHRRIAHEFATRIRPAALWALATASVVYFLAARAEHLERAETSVEAIRLRWGGEVGAIDLLDA